MGNIMERLNILQNHDRINNSPAERSLQHCSNTSSELESLTQFLLLGKAEPEQADGENETIPDWALLFKHRHFETFTSAQPESEHQTKSRRMPRGGMGRLTIRVQ